MLQSDIVNAALGRLGVDPIGNINDTTKAAKTARIFWPLAVAAVSRAEDWNRLTTSCTPKKIEDIVWTALTAYNVGDFVVTDRYLLKCSKAGTSGATEPDVYEYNVTDGTVTWDSMDILPLRNYGYSYAFLYPEYAEKVISVGGTDYKVFGWFIFTDEETPEVTYIRKIITVDTLDGLLKMVIVAKLAELMASTFGQAAIVPQLVQEYELARMRARQESSDEQKEDAPEEKLWTESV